MTVYDRSHIGHARSVMVFDVICRYLTFKGYRVTLVRNFTDIDDKIIAAAKQKNVPASEISRRYIAEFRSDMEAIGVLPPPPGIVYHEPKATDFVPEMIALIERLVAKGFAYVVDGDVYFEIARFPRYGRLSGRNLDELLAGARVDVDERKRDPRDFALWKASKPGEPTWAGPWGPGRPGWHIECSVMSAYFLGDSFDIHGGGADLIFPHHECEIAQSEADTGKPLAHYWLHNGLVNLGTEKMSKSRGNILFIPDLLEHHHAEALRRYLLGTHYRRPLDFWEARLGDSTRAIGALRILAGGAFHLASKAGASLSEPADADLKPESIEQILKVIEGDELRDQIEIAYTRFIRAMDDDFNTPDALGALSDLGHTLNRYRDAGVERERLNRFLSGVRVLLVLGRVLGLLYRHVNPFEISAVQRAEVEPLIVEREEARKRRDWSRADEIRGQIDALGFVVEDTASGTRIKCKGTPPE